MQIPRTRNALSDIFTIPFHSRNSRKQHPKPSLKAPQESKWTTAVKAHTCGINIYLSLLPVRGISLTAWTTEHKAFENSA